MPTSETTAINLGRRRPLRSAALGVMVAGATHLLPAQRAAASEDDAIRPFKIDIPEGQLVNAADIAGPAAVSIFPGENYRAPRSWVERAYHQLIYFNELDRGEHYAAWEQPELFSSELRAAFRSLRPPS